MKRSIFSISVSGLLLAAFAIGVLAPVAEAKSKGSRRYKSNYSSKHYGSSYGHRSGRRVVEIHHRSSSAGPAIAGFIGGLVLGTVISRSSSEPEPYYRPAAREEYDYYDPYCDDHFTSLVSYRRHAYHRHPAVVRVIEVDSGRCAHVYRYQRGGWEEYDEGDYNYD